MACCFFNRAHQARMKRLRPYVLFSDELEFIVHITPEWRATAPPLDHFIGDGMKGDGA